MQADGRLVSGTRRFGPAYQGKLPTPLSREEAISVANHDQRVRYYVVTSCEHNPWLVGITRDPWSVVSNQLPGRLLPGPGATLKAFDSAKGAEAYWCQLCKGDPVAWL